MSKRRYLAQAIMIVFGVALWVLGFMDVVDAFWAGMGSALIVVGALRVVRMVRFVKDENYREKVEIAVKDERNQFIRNKAWAWTGYLFVMIAAVLTIVFRVMGQETLSMVCSGAVCLMVVLYWGSCFLLSRKY